MSEAITHKYNSSSNTTNMKAVKMKLQNKPVHVFNVYSQ